MLTGSCACGAVAFEADAAAAPITYCNCRTCRKVSGTAFGANMSVPRNVFRWVRGEDRLGNYESSPGKIRRFCASCGSAMTAERPANPAAAVRIRLGVVDTPIENATYVGHIWRSEAADWYDPKRAVPEWQEAAPQF
jgi:hypothetical protein